MLTLRSIRVVCGDDGHAGTDARRVSNYLLDRSASPQAFALDGGDQRSNSMWLGAGDTLSKLGLERGADVTTRQMEAALEGRHAITNDRVRFGRWVKDEGYVLRSLEATWSVPKSVSVLRSQARGRQLEDLDRAVVVSSDRALQYLLKMNEVVRYRVGEERMAEVARGFAASATLHVVSRPAAGEVVPSPQVHVHTAIVGVEGADGRVRSPDQFTLFRNGVPLEGGAVFRAMLAHELVKLGYEIQPGTGTKRRYFEIAGVPEGLRDRMSARTHEILASRQDIEEARQQPMSSREAARLALLTRRHKIDVDPAVAKAVWAAHAAEFGFSAEKVAALIGSPGYGKDVETRWQEAREAVEEYMRERGPTVTATGARTIAYEVAQGRMSVEDAHALVQELQIEGALLTLAAREGETRVTTPGIRELEQQVMTVARDAAARGDSPLSPEARAIGLATANAALGPGKSLAWEQEQAFEMLTSGAGWSVLTGRAGTGKNPTLHAVAAAYQADGWQVIACATDNTNATQLAQDLAGDGSAIDAYSITRVLVRTERGLLTVDDRTLILIDEAGKVGTEQWSQIAKLVDQYGARVAAVGHAGQHDAIRLPGLFAQMADERSGIPVRRLVEIRRHRDPNDPSKLHPWLPEYQVAVDEARGEDAVSILRRENAITLYDTRQDAMEAMVAEWDQWRRPYPVEQCVMLVHGSNADVDAVNVLAQQRRYEAGELSRHSVEAVDRSYRLRVGDSVMLRNSAYVLGPQEGGPRRVENGQVATIQAIDVQRDVVTVRLIGRGKGAGDSVDIDMGRLRREHADELFRLAAGGKPAPSLPPSLRLFYGCHTFPEQGATEAGTAELGHPVQGKESSYVAASRAKYRHSVHVAREDLLIDEELDTPGIVTEIPDEEFFGRYADKLQRSQRKQASIAYPLDGGTPIAGTMPRFASTPQFPTRGRGLAGDPLEPYARLLGEDLAERLDRLADAKERHLPTDLAALLATRDRAALALKSLDGAAALEIQRLEAQRRGLR
ncbi:MobF family relaxase, partial [Actinophytocola sp.]|uniref:MobF family relaxase n=1 Tax=Actinophytocola sp. TaxID=1872138 RepID=UPI002ED0909C